MKQRIAIAATAVVTLIMSMLLFAEPAHAAVGIRVTNGKLVEANGTPLKLRGINHAHTWYPSQTNSFADIKAAGANAVRVVLSGGRWTANTAADVSNVISLCKANKLICVLENHDTTGFGEQSGSVSLDTAVNYWISIQSALTGQENYVILNIGNEPFGNNAVTPNWTSATSSAIQRLRTAGFQHTIMVDAPNWGQDWGFTMRDTAPSVLAADTTGNTIFSIHMYGVFDTAAEVTAYISSFTSRNLALCVCEFGDMHSDGNPDEDTILSATQAAGIGNMAWSWSGNGGGVEYLDLVTSFNPAQRSSWGNRYITGANGLSTTSTQATIYGGTTPDTTPPSTPSGLAASGTTSTSTTLGWTASTDNVGVTGYDILRAPGTSGGSFAVVGSSTTTSFTNTGLTAATAYRYQVRAKDAAGNVSAVSSTVTVTTSSGGGDTTAPSAPTGLTTSGTTSTSTTLGWTASTDNVGVTGYDILRAPGASGGSFAVVGSSTTTSFTNTGLTASTTYRYQVRAKDAAGNLSAVSSTLSVMTSSGGGGGGCTATGTAQSTWSNGYVLQPVTVTNTGTATITSWTVTVTLPAGHALTGSWNATFTTSGQVVTAKSISWNGTLAPGASTSFGLQASRPNGDTSLPTGYTCTTP
ncbi:mannan endo-1,4-beta-mannosidase [Allocatelliglobosispora scoriae]|uniref:Endoglucanase n=1 Tax=Allocatelliglobosispora scoriae TaxID=643052 RepID=A0A841BZZ8_9ACTN|nr:cellulase family glycosylhydrolase [Allocatelliglobosispora scoriae]MBB5873068.1 mannan endo-1,4-beta-mannosidase [Allocatelliglobosispora scoriae]